MGDTGFRGAKLLCAAINRILEHPETWDQHHWHCGTVHCIAGHCELLAGSASYRTKERARKLLRISETEAEYLFWPLRTLPEIYNFALGMLGVNTRPEVEWHQLRLELVPFDLNAL